MITHSLKQSISDLDEWALKENVIKLATHKCYNIQQHRNFEDPKQYLSYLKI